MNSTITRESLDDQLLADVLLELVSGLPSECASSLAEACEKRTYSRGDLIIGEGEADPDLILLISGTVKPMVSNRSSGATVSLQPISAPAILGLAPVMLAQPSPVTILAVTAVNAAFIPRTEFLRLLTQFPEAGLAFSQVIANELALTYSHLSRLRGGLRFAPASAI